MVKGLRNSFQSKGIFFFFFAFYQEDKNRPSCLFTDLKFDIKARCISMFNVASQPSALSKMCHLRCKYRLQLSFILPMLYFGLDMLNADGIAEILLSQLEALEQRGGSLNESCSASLR